METLLILSITCIGLSLIPRIRFLFRGETNIMVKDLKISKRAFVLLVIKWCETNFGKIQHPYELKLYYYKNKTYAGFYQFTTKSILLYITNDLAIINLIDTIIHEYIHHLQFRNKTNIKDYYKNLNEIGYWDNKYEVQARKLAKNYRDKCFEDICNIKGNNMI